METKAIKPSESRPNDPKASKPSMPQSAAEGGAAGEKENWGMTTAAFYETLRKKQVQIVLMDSKGFRGELVGVNRFDLVLKQAGTGALILIMKHAIKWIGLATEGNGQTATGAGS